MKRLLFGLLVVWIGVRGGPTVQAGPVSVVNGFYASVTPAAPTPKVTLSGGAVVNSFPDPGLPPSDRE